MEMLQQILVYLTLFWAVAFLAKKFLIPKSLFSKNKSVAKSCGQDDCGCH